MSIGGLLDVPAGPERWESVYGMMEGYIRDFSPDVIHAHNLHYFFPDHAEALGVLSKKYGIPIVLTIHNYWEDDLCRHLLADIGWSMVVSVSYHLKKSCLFDARLPPDKVEVHYHGIDLGKYRASEDREALKEKLGLSGRKVIFHPARMCEMKGTLHSIEAVSRLKENTRTSGWCLAATGTRWTSRTSARPSRMKVHQMLNDLKVSDTSGS